jgi:hypothetical protein
MINLFVQARTKSHRHHTVQVLLNKAPVCTWNMSSSDDDALALAAFVLMCKIKTAKEET